MDTQPGIDEALTNSTTNADEGPSTPSDEAAIAAELEAMSLEAAQARAEGRAPSPRDAAASLAIATAGSTEVASDNSADSDVAAWLGARRLGHYATALEREGFDNVDDLSAMARQDLLALCEEIGGISIDDPPATQPAVSTQPAGASTGESDSGSGSFGKNLISFGKKIQNILADDEIEVAWYYSVQPGAHGADQWLEFDPMLARKLDLARSQHRARIQVDEGRAVDLAQMRLVKLSDETQWHTVRCVDPRAVAAAAASGRSISESPERPPLVKPVPVALGAELGSTESTDSAAGEPEPEEDERSPRDPDAYAKELMGLVGSLGADDWHAQVVEWTGDKFERTSIGQALTQVRAEKNGVLDSAALFERLCDLLNRGILAAFEAADHSNAVIFMNMINTFSLDAEPSNLRQPYTGDLAQVLPVAGAVRMASAYA
jgi:hypothetical protein